jgi:subtilisin family serine protease
MLPIYVWPGDDVRLRWDDTPRFATHDYDLYVVTEGFRDNHALENNPAILAVSADLQNGSGDPFEEVTLDIQEPQWLYVVVRHDPASPAADQPLYVWTSGYMDPGFANPDGSVSVPADARAAVAVGSVAIDSLEVEPYSSRGPTNDGRIKPELVAPDGVSTEAYGELAFYGTSAAAPHVAGAAALILAAEPGLTAFELRDRLLAATPRTPEEADNIVGRGLLDLDRAP